MYQVAYWVILFKNVFRENKRSNEPDFGLFGLIFWKIGLPLSDPSVSQSSCLADSLTVALLWWRWAAGAALSAEKGCKLSWGEARLTSSWPADQWWVLSATENVAAWFPFNANFGLESSIWRGLCTMCCLFATYKPHAVPAW